MQHKLSRTLLALGSAILFSTTGFLLTERSEARSAPAVCALNEDAATIYFRTAAQLEPVGGSYVSGCGAPSPNMDWGSTSPYFSMSCNPSAHCDERSLTY